MDVCIVKRLLVYFFSLKSFPEKQDIIKQGRPKPNFWCIRSKKFTVRCYLNYTYAFS